MVVIGVAAEGGDGGAFDGVGDFGPRDGQADGRAVAQAFGAGDDVGLHAPLLDAEPFAAGAAPAGLHFVADEHAAIFLDDVGDDREIFLGRRDEAADALNRLGDEAGDAAGGGGADHFLHVVRALDVAGGIREAVGAAVAVGVHGVNDPGLRDRTEPPAGLRRQPHGQRRPAMIGVAQRDDFAWIRCNSARPESRFHWLRCRCW